MTKPLLYKGRGVASNHTGRYEAQTTELVDDGWGGLDADLPPLLTETWVDNTRTVLNYNQSPDLPFDRSLNPYRGCEHGCVYCFARPTHAYLGLSPGLDFESKLLYKPDAAQLLKAELSRRNYRCAPIAIGTNTDAYQPIEREHKIMRQVLAVLLETRHPVTIVTKSSLIERDIDLLSELAQLQLVTVGISLASLDGKLARLLEPRAATPKRRLAVIKQLHNANIPVHVLAAPMIPGLNDHELENVITTASESGAQSAEYILLRLPLEVASLFEEWLRLHYPLKAEHVMQLIRDMRLGKTYDATFFQRMVGSGVYAELLSQRFKLITKRQGLNQGLPNLRCDLFKPPHPAGQMSFDFFT